MKIRTINYQSHTVMIPTTIAHIGSTLFQIPLQRGLRLTDDRTAGPYVLLCSISLQYQDLFQNPALPCLHVFQLWYSL